MSKLLHLAGSRENARRCVPIKWLLGNLNMWISSSTFWGNLEDSVNFNFVKKKKKKKGVTQITSKILQER